MEGGADPFAGLLSAVRGAFSLAPASPVRLTWTDADGDVITVANVRSPPPAPPPAAREELRAS